MAGDFDESAPTRMEQCDLIRVTTHPCGCRERLGLDEREVVQWQESMPCYAHRMPSPARLSGDHTGA